jgi:hypothetical protein
MSNSTKGAAPIIAEKLKLEIAGREYKMRRLGFTDINQLAPFIAKALKTVQIDDTNASKTGFDIAGFVLDNYTDLLPWFSSLIGMTVEEINNPDVFPLGDMGNVVDTLLTHPDWTAFMESVGKRIPSLLKARTTN